MQPDGKRIHDDSSSRRTKRAHPQSPVPSGIPLPVRERRAPKAPGEGPTVKRWLVKLILGGGIGESKAQTFEVEAKGPRSASGIARAKTERAGFFVARMVAVVEIGAFPGGPSPAAQKSAATSPDRGEVSGAE
jgi:hypothetical protein